MSGSGPGEGQVQAEAVPAASRGAGMGEAFTRAARVASNLLGSPWAFLAAVLCVAVWGASGPLFGFSQTWQLVINTATTIVTFLMVFLIQNTQNRDSKAFHLKLDELLRGLQGARTGMVQLEDLTDEELRRLQEEFQVLREKHPLVEATAELIEDSVEGEVEERKASAVR